MKQEEKLEEAKRLYQTANADQRYVLESLFPELKESEDERIRKGLIKAVSGTLKGTKLFGTDVTRDEALAWLGKQGEKPKKVSIWKHWKDGIAGGAADEQVFLIKIGSIYSISSCLGCECDYIELSELDKLMREEKTKWDDKDEELLQHCCGAIAAADYYTLEDKEEMENWLKTIKQRWRNEQ